MASKHARNVEEPMSTIPLRPLDFGEILDTAFGLFRRDYRLYMPLSLVGLVPASVATVIPTSADTEPEVLLSDLGSGLLFFGLLAVGLLFSLMAWAALVTAMEARIGGRRASIGSSYARALALLPKLTGATCLALLALVAAVLVVTIPTSFLTAMAVRDRSLLGAAVIAIVIGVTMVVVMALWATHTYMLVPAIVIEERGPIRALRRSFGMVRGSRARVFFVFAVAWIMAVVPGVAAFTLTGAGDAILASNPAETAGLVRYWAIQIVSLGFQSVTTPLWVACAMVLYHDLRARSEGADLQAAARAMAG